MTLLDTPEFRKVVEAVVEMPNADEAWDIADLRLKPFPCRWWGHEVEGCSECDRIKQENDSILWCRNEVASTILRLALPFIRKAIASELRAEAEQRVLRGAWRDAARFIEEGK